MMILLGGYLRRRQGLFNVWTYQQATTINYAISIEWVLAACKTITMTSWMQMQQALWDSSATQNVSVLTYFAKLWRRMREILYEWYDFLLERANQGAAFVDDLPAGNGMSS
jgi:hypothetical protein